jgi:hypothetical protein
MEGGKNTKFPQISSSTVGGSLGFPALPWIPPPVLATEAAASGREKGAQFHPRASGSPLLWPFTRVLFHVRLP